MNSLRTTFVRNAPRAFVRSPAMSVSGRRFASSDYGSGKGDPKGENPQEQGANPSADKEHPGPPPPKAGQGSGGATKGTSTGNNTDAAKQQKKSFSTMARRMATSDYGSGKGDPKGEDPQAQGANPSADKEHPGPPPPKVGQGSGGATKGTSTGNNTDAAKQQKKSFSTMARRMSEEHPKSTKGLKPALNKSDAPAPAEKDLPEDVKKHNKEMDERADQANEKLGEDKSKKGDKVGKEFWYVSHLLLQYLLDKLLTLFDRSGHGGADRQP
ncbi:hypothetical protein D6D23_02418 [Aureobasidium pullulans]|nr:hypothetical protein D6D29_00910 [Aureobasidium pullulans]THW00694.1 hypothetical protein D6D26_05564 [Aureobasidium pullulans]THW27935.1 hypothetical protein D6D23_02418 [Aureobasidium pullulans]THW89839.1 hypothetical protein D6D18_06854 [Aureobasidium pullulans]